MNSELDFLIYFVGSLFSILMFVGAMYAVFLGFTQLFEITDRFYRARQARIPALKVRFPS